MADDVTNFFGQIYGKGCSKLRDNNQIMPKVGGSLINAFLTNLNDVDLKIFINHGGTYTLR